MMLPPDTPTFSFKLTIRYSPLSVIVPPGVNVTVEVPSALVVRVAVVVPTRTALGSALHRSRQDLAAPIRMLIPTGLRPMRYGATANVNVSWYWRIRRLADSRSKNHRPPDGRAVVNGGCADGRWPSVPYCSLKFAAAAILPTTKPETIVDAPGSTSDSEPKPLTATSFRKNVLTVIYLPNATCTNSAQSGRRVLESMARRYSRSGSRN